MTFFPCPPARLYFHDGNGHPLSGGTLSTYINNSSTPIQTYRDGLGTAKNPVTITLDDRGEARVFLDPRIVYRLVVRDRIGATVIEQDGICVPSGDGEGGGTIGVNVKSDDGTVSVVSSMDGDVLVFDLSVKSYVDESVNAEAEARKDADGKIAEYVDAVVKSVETETTERKEADAELAKAIAGKQSPLQDGDNIHIDENSKINVVNRKTLSVESPLTIAKTSTQLILGIRPDAFATADDIASEATERKAADETLESSIAGKQDGPFTFDSNSSTSSEVMAAITAGRTIVSGSGASFSTWQGSIIGGVANLFRVYETDVYHYYYSFGQWAFERLSLATVPAMGRLTLPLNGTGTLSYGDWTFAFSVNSIQAAVVNIKNEKATSADIFSESRTYGNTVRLVGQDLSSGKDIVYCGNGDFQTIPARIVMDIRTGSEWIELRMMQFTSGSNLVIDYRIGGANG